jgi:hydrogenase maturation protein HypF
MIGGDASMRDGWKSAICRKADHASMEHKRDGSFCATHEHNGDRSSFDVDVSYAVCYARENGTLSAYSGERGVVEAALALGVNTVRTSSMGRLFDAVASLLGVCHVNRYEGECAVML